MCEGQKPQTILQQVRLKTVKSLQFNAQFQQHQLSNFNETNY